MATMSTAAADPGDPSPVGPVEGAIRTKVCIMQPIPACVRLQLIGVPISISIQIDVDIRLRPTLIAHAVSPWLAARRVAR